MSEDLQQKYLELQMLDSHIKKLQKNFENAVAQSAQLQEIMDHFENLKNVKSDTKMLASLAPGIFVKAKIESPQKVLIGVGKGVVVEKDLDSAKKILEKEVNELNKMLEELKQEITEGTQQLYSLQEEVNKMNAKSQQQF